MPGVLVGWLYAIYVHAPLLSALALGGLLGVIVGYALAERAAREPDGPGAVHLILVKTTERVMTVRRCPTFRQRPLRSYPLGKISSTASTRLPVGMYERLTVHMSDGTNVDFIVTSGLDTVINPSEHKGDFRVD